MKAIHQGEAMEYVCAAILIMQIEMDTRHSDLKLKSTYKCSLSLYWFATSANIIPFMNKPLTLQHA